MQKLKVLIFSPLLPLDAPQPIRFRKFVECWKNQFDVHVLCYKSSRNLEVEIPPSNIHLMDYNKLGKILIKSRLVWNHSKSQTNSQKKTGLKKIQEIFAFIYRKLSVNSWFFPDIFIVESFNMQKKLLATIRLVRPEFVILSASPFTILRYSKVIKNKYPSIKVIFDTGDPLFCNSVISRFQLCYNLRSKHYERKFLKFIDLLVVPTPILKEHYLRHFDSILSKKKISVVEQGVDLLQPARDQNNSQPISNFTLVYAGSFYKKLREPCELYKAIMQFDEKEICLKVFGFIRPYYQPPINNARFLYGGLINNKEVINHYNTATMSVFIDNKNGVQIPGKVFELIALKKPILYIYHDNKSPTYSILNQYGGVISCRNNAKDIHQAIRSYMNHEVELNYDFPIHEYTWHYLGNKYKDIIFQIN